MVRGARRPGSRCRGVYRFKRASRGKGMLADATGLRMVIRVMMLCEVEEVRSCAKTDVTRYSPARCKGSPPYHGPTNKTKPGSESVSLPLRRQPVLLELLIPVCIAHPCHVSSVDSQGRNNEGRGQDELWQRELSVNPMQNQRAIMILLTGTL